MSLRGVLDQRHAAALPRSSGSRRGRRARRRGARSRSRESSRSRRLRRRAGRGSRCPGPRPRRPGSRPGAGRRARREACVIAGTITSSPGPTRAAISAACRAAVPDETATAWRVPQRAARPRLEAAERAVRRGNRTVLLQRAPELVELESTEAGGRRERDATRRPAPRLGRSPAAIEDTPGELVPGLDEVEHRTHARTRTLGTATAHVGGEHTACGNRLRGPLRVLTSPRSSRSAMSPRSEPPPAKLPGDRTGTSVRVGLAAGPITRVTTGATTGATAGVLAGSLLGLGDGLVAAAYADQALGPALLGVSAAIFVYAGIAAVALAMLAIVAAPFPRARRPGAAAPPAAHRGSGSLALARALLVDAPAPLLRSLGAGARATRRRRRGDRRRERRRVVARGALCASSRRARPALAPNGLRDRRRRPGLRGARRAKGLRRGARSTTATATCRTCCSSSSTRCARTTSAATAPTPSRRPTSTASPLAASSSSAASCSPRSPCRASARSSPASTRAGTAWSRSRPASDSRGTT